MRIAVASEDFKRVSGNSGGNRRFIIYDFAAAADAAAVVWLDLPPEMSLPAFGGDWHPLDEVDVVLMANAGHGLVARLAQRGLKLVACGESDPRQAAYDYRAGKVKAANPHAHLELERHDRPAGMVAA